MGPGKPTDSSSSSSVCKYDSNGNQDRVKLCDFNFIMVLGKGSFGKVLHIHRPLWFTLAMLESHWREFKMYHLSCPGDAG